MATSNSFAKAELFQTMLDEQMVQLLTSGFMEANSSLVKYNGGDTLRIAKMTMDGLGDYSRSTGYDAGSAVLTWESHKFEMDRSKAFVLDRNDVDETNFVATAGAVMGEFQRVHVVPEVDAYRYSKVFSIANLAEKTGNYLPAVGTIFSQLIDDLNKVEDEVGENEPLVIAMSYPVWSILQKSTEKDFAISETEMKIGNITTKVKSVNGYPIIPVSSKRFKTAYTFASSGDTGSTAGFTAKASAIDMNWIIMSRNSALGIVKTDKPKIIDPDSNQTHDGWSIMYRKYHDVFIPDNKLNAVYISYKTVTATALAATVEAGAVAGTKFTATAGVGNTLGYILSETALTANMNDLPDLDDDDYTSGADIATATEGEYLNMYEIDANGRVVKFLSKVLASGDIKS